MNNYIHKIFNRKPKRNTSRFFEHLSSSLNSSKPALSEIFDDLEDNYCEAGKLLGSNIYLGSIYMFKYKQKEQSTYNTIKFKDPSPMILVTAENNDLIRGINLNLCTKELKVLILNIICNLDEKFFDGQYVEMCDANKKPLSNNVLKFMADKGEQQIIEALKRHFKDIDYNSIFRTYKKSNIEHIKFIEWYIWPYVPDIVYTGIPPFVLKEYWKQSKIDQIKM